MFHCAQLIKARSDNSLSLQGQHGLAWPPPCTARGWPCSRLLRIACSTVHTLSQPADRTTPPPSAAPQDCLPLGVGKGTHIKGAIVDKNARIGKFCKIVNAEGIQVRACVWMLVLLQGWAGACCCLGRLEGQPQNSGGGGGGGPLARRAALAPGCLPILKSALSE